MKLRSGFDTETPECFGRFHIKSQFVKVIQPDDQITEWTGELENHAYGDRYTAKKTNGGTTIRFWWSGTQKACNVCGLIYCTHYGKSLPTHTQMFGWGG